MKKYKLLFPILLSFSFLVGCDSSETPEVITPTGYQTNALNESMINKQVYLNSVGDIFSVWEKYRGDDVTLAVIDGGFDINHPEFKNSDGSSKILSTSCSFTYNTSTAKVVRQVGRENVKITDGDSHGTFCAAVAAGSITGQGIVGIAPNADLMLLKTDKRPKSIVDAFKYAADNGAKVITISIGSYADYMGDLIDDGSNLTTCFDEAVSYAKNKGVVVCSAAGNGGECARPTQFTYPGGTKGVIGVGGLAYNEDAYLWSGSSYNSSANNIFCDIFAPGENLFSGAYLNNQSTYDGGWNGTSFSSPQVAGAACLYFQKYPNKTNIDFENDLYRTAVKFNETGKNTGYGRLDIGALLDETSIEQEASITFKASTWWNADGANTYYYVWNSKKRTEKSTWPGTKLTNNNFIINLDEYDTVIFSRCSSVGEDWNARTINLSLSLLSKIGAYSIENVAPTWFSESGAIVGQFEKGV